MCAAETAVSAARVCSPQINVSEPPRGPLVHPGGGCAPFPRAEPAPRLWSKQPRRGTGAQSGPCCGGGSTRAETEDYAQPAHPHRKDPARRRPCFVYTPPTSS